MATDAKPIQSEVDYNAAMEEAAALWGSASTAPGEDPAFIDAISDRDDGGG